MAEYVVKEAAIKEIMSDVPEQVGYSREDDADCIRYMDAADVARCGMDGGRSKVGFTRARSVE